MYRTTRVIKWLSIAPEIGVSCEDLSGEARRKKSARQTDNKVTEMCFIKGLQSRWVS